MKSDTPKPSAVLEQKRGAGARNQRARGALAREREAHAATLAANQRLKAILSLTDTALAHLTLDDLLRELQQRIHEVMGVDNSAILLLDESGQYLNILTAYGGEEEVIGKVRIPMGKGIAGRIAASRKPLIADDLTKEEVVNNFLKEKMRSLVGVPLLVENRVIGVIHVDTATPHHFTQEDVELLELVAQRVALAIDHARLYEAAQRARAEALESARQLEALFESLADALLQIDAQGKLVRANQAFYDLVKPEARPEFLRLPLAERLRLLELRSVSGEPLPLDKLPIAHVLRGEVLNHDHAADVIFRTLDGREIEASMSGAPLRNERGEITGGVLVIRDVTERRQLVRRTYEALNALLEMAQALVAEPGKAVLDESRPPEEAGQVARRLAELTCRVLGCSRISTSVIEPETEVIRPLTVVGLSPEEERQWWAEQPPNARLSDSPDQAAVEQLRNGELLVYDLRQPPYNELPNPYHITTMLVLPMLVGRQLVGLITLDHGGPEHHYTSQELDLAQAVARLTALVIERDRLLRQREEARANEMALLAANKQMSDFLGIASHELLTPLTSIKAHLQLAERRMSRLTAPNAFPDGIHPSEIATKLQPFQVMLGRLNGQTERMSRLVGELLDVTRIQAGRFTLQLVPCDLKPIVQGAVDEQRLSWTHREISLTLPERPVRVQGDPERLGQVVTNYLTNALKYSPPEAPVAVALRLEEGQARVEVRDRGPSLCQV